MVNLRSAALAVAVAFLALPSAAGAGTPPVYVQMQADRAYITVQYPAPFTAPISIDTHGTTTTGDDDLVVSAYGYGDASCANSFGNNPYETSSTRCPLGTRSKIAIVYYRDNASSQISLDLDRPGLTMTTTVTEDGPSPTSGDHLIDASPTSHGIFDFTARHVIGSSSDDVITGTSAADDLIGGPGDDSIIGLGASDSLKGGSGDDGFLPGGAGSIGAFVTDSVDGGDGDDTLSLAESPGNTVVSLNETDDGDRSFARFHELSLRRVENVAGSGGRDVITGSGGPNRLVGLAGNDLIDGGGGSGDVLRGGSDDDELRARNSPAAFGDVGCGGGNDVAIVDALDLVAPDCENADRSAPDSTPGSTTSQGEQGQSTTVVVGEGGDRSAPGLQLGKLPTKVKRSALLKGLVVTVTPDENASFAASLLGTVRTATVAKVGEITLAEAKAGMGAGARKLKLKPKRKLLGKAKKLTLLIVATDASGNRRELRKQLRVTGR